jgi:hypothetical protein
MTTFATEAENGVITCAFGNGDDFTPHVGLSLSHQGSGNDAQVIVSRLCPDDARCLADALGKAAAAVQIKYDAHIAEMGVDENA